MADTQLIPIADANIGGALIRTVNARELHAFLGVGKHFRDWIKERIEQYGFVENQDYVIAAQNGAAIDGNRGGHNRVDYCVSIDMAKELAMVERNEKGREARKYFLDCERLAQNTSAMQASKSRLQIAEELVESIKREEALLLFQRTHVHFDKSAPKENGADAISVLDIKDTLVPWMQPEKIRKVLKHYEHPETVSRPTGNDMTVKMFERDGLEEVFERFLNECTRHVSRNRKTLIIQHECLIGAEMRVKKDKALAADLCRIEAFD